MSRLQNKVRLLRNKQNSVLFFTYLRTYGTLRYGSTRTDQRYVTVSYVTLREGGKQALYTLARHLWRLCVSLPPSSIMSLCLSVYSVFLPATAAAQNENRSD